MNRVCVFCGSSQGARPAYGATARGLVAALAERDLGLVYGGANVGLMGELANAARACGVHVTGVMPSSLVEREIAHGALDDVRIVGSMHERKELMAALSDGFVALPGGIGTLEELFEVLTWAQLGLHRKPCGLLDVEGFFAPLEAFLDHTVTEGFLALEHRRLLLVDTDPGALLDRMWAYEPAFTEKWTDRPGRA
ncbi:MAG TPA: TIGR00730 family Rossman fold protein [Candidatus Binatia bacterium]|nr:TIGR00730 family Rossman fold protein [Candidatus Binatia bacterium]